MSRKRSVRQIGEYKVDRLQQDLSVKRPDWDFYVTGSEPSSESEMRESFNLNVWICMKEGGDSITLPTTGVLG